MRDGSVLHNMGGLPSIQKCVKEVKDLKIQYTKRNELLVIREPIRKGTRKNKTMIIKY